MSSKTTVTTKQAGGAGLALGALGVVYGDIGTSPLYTVQQIFNGTHPIALSRFDILGGLSLVFWSLMIVVSFKYVLVVMHANNDGEGGIMALIALVRRISFENRKTQAALIGLGILGASLFYGDALITPAISVLSAVEGLKVSAPGLHDFVIPITLVIVCVLFAVQHYGTDAVGRMFGPVMVVWFLVLGVLGVVGIAKDTEVLKALSPTFAIDFLFDKGFLGYLILGAVVLAVTGAEALYADMGHFGRKPISQAWFFMVLPCLLLNYFGQGALLLHNPATIDNPFFRLAPGWGQLPLVVLSTLATIIASQAVISGAFSLSYQAVRLGYLPFLRTRHTSAISAGQVYLPGINLFMMLAIILVVLFFGSSAALASAYGLAVTGTFTITTILAAVIAYDQWHKPLWLVLLLGIPMMVIDLTFFTANAAKIDHGGWFPLCVAGLLYILLMTWHRGRTLLTSKRVQQEGLLQDFVNSLSTARNAPTRVPGTAVFLNANSQTTPLSLRYNVEHNHVLHEHVVVLTVETVDQPHVDEADQVSIDDLIILDDGISLVKARFGFADTPDAPKALEMAVAKGLEMDVANASYFITRSTIKVGMSGDMMRWRKLLFIALNRNAGTGVLYFCLPEDRVVVLGSAIAL